MKIDLHEEIEVPEGISANIEDEVLVVKKGADELRRGLNPTINFRVEGNKIIVESKKATRREQKIFFTFLAHINNMTKGLQEKFKYKLQVATVHFPVTVSVDKEKNELVVKNFLGEKTDRRIKLNPKVEVKVDKNIIEVESIDKELAGQVAANIEKGTRVRNKDRRVYQDGIYITEKPGRIFE